MKKKYIYIYGIYKIRKLDDKMIFILTLNYVKLRNKEICVCTYMCMCV